MSNRYRTHHDPGEDDVFAFTDRLATGDAPAPANEVEATALRVQQAFGATARPEPTMPPDLKASLWEDIMHATSYQPTAGPLPARPSGASRTRAGGPPPRQYPRMMWTGVANVALAILVVVALFGAWQGVRNNSDPTEPATLPAVSMQGGTPASESAVAAGSPEASPAAISDCDLSGDIPLVTDLRDDEHPVPGTVLYVVQPDYTMQDPRGILKLGCEGEEPVVLAENVIGAWAGPWPGTVSVTIQPPETDDPLKAMPGFVDIASGATLTFGASAQETYQWLTFVDGSPWVIGPSPDNAGSLLIGDLRTMKARLAADVASAEITENMSILLSSPAEDGAIVVGFVETHPLGGDSGTVQAVTDAPANLVLLGASFEKVLSITLPESLTTISGVSLSPSGKLALVTSASDGMNQTHLLIRLTDGSILGQSTEVPFTNDSQPAWIQKGSAIAYVNGSRIETLAVDGDGQPVVAFEAPSPLYHLQTTYDPDVVVASTRRDHGSDASATDTAQDMVYSANVRTGEVHEFRGLDASSTVSWITDAVALVMYEWQDEPPASTTYTFYDPVTGEPIGEMDNAPPVQVPERNRSIIGPNSIAVSEDGSTEVMTLGTPYILVFTATDGRLTVSGIPAPEGQLSEHLLTANVYLSPDGSLLSLGGQEDESRSRYLFSLDDIYSDDPVTEWIGFPNEVVGDQGRGLITFVDTGQD